MKKIFKRVLVFVLALSLSLCLCSCANLDDIKRERATYLNNTKTEIEFRDTKYKLLDKNISNYLISYSLGDNARVVTNDVPLLLTEMMGKAMYYSEKDTRLVMVEELFYCREDTYDYATKLIKDNVFDYVCVEFYDYKTDTLKIKMLDKRIIDVVDEVIETVQPLDDFPRDENRTYESVSVRATDKEAMFMHGLFNVEKLLDGRYFITMDNLADDIYGYIAPKKYADVFEPLFPEPIKMEVETGEEYGMYL